MNIIDSNQYVIELVAYVLILIAYFFESISNAFGRNPMDSKNFFSQCRFKIHTSAFGCTSFVIYPRRNFSGILVGP